MTPSPSPIPLPSQQAATPPSLWMVAPATTASLSPDPSPPPSPPAADETRLFSPLPNTASSSLAPSSSPTPMAPPPPSHPNPSASQTSAPVVVAISSIMAICCATPLPPITAPILSPLDTSPFAKAAPIRSSPLIPTAPLAPPAPPLLPASATQPRQPLSLITLILITPPTAHPPLPGASPVQNLPTR